ncbi:14222_t:CDS:2 [Entrophospora sp. SA101]|nr:14222_t:CDS:2 [Entrophospora sp. SA101]
MGDIAFPGVNFWLNYVMSSLCRRKKLQESLYAILCMANVISHTQRHERKLAMKRANELDISEKLIRNNENIWNLCVIDNIDFQEKTFGYNNIFDVTRRTTHSTLRMVFQFKLPHPLSTISSNSDLVLGHSFHVGMSTFTEKEIEHFENTFSLLWNLYGRDFDVAQVQEELWKNVEIGYLIKPPNVIILKPDSTGHLDLASDESIFRKLNKLNESETEISLLLGAWHTSKAMCGTLLTIFSGYGIYNLAANLGVSYLEKLEKVVDYSATCRVIEHIWIGDALWKLITDLEKAFEHSNKSILTPEVPELFKGAIECSNQGFQKLYNSYDIGINRSNDIFKQDIERSVVWDTTGKNNNECEYKDEYKKYTGECKTQ